MTKEGPKFDSEGAPPNSRQLELKFSTKKFEKRIQLVILLKRFPRLCWRKYGGSGSVVTLKKSNFNPVAKGKSEFMLIRILVGGMDKLSYSF